MSREDTVTSVNFVATMQEKFLNRHAITKHDTTWNDRVSQCFHCSNHCKKKNLILQASFMQQILQRKHFVTCSFQGILYCRQFFQATFVPINSQDKLQEIMPSTAVPWMHSFNSWCMYLEKITYSKCTLKTVSVKNQGPKVIGILQICLTNPQMVLDFFGFARQK